MWKRRKVKKKSALSKILVVIAILMIVVLIFFSVKSGLFSIKQVEVEAKDGGCFDKSSLINGSGILGQNFWFINSTKTEDTLQKKFFCIRSVGLSRYFPDKVKLQIFSRQPQAILISLKNEEASISSVENIATPSALEVQEKYLVDNEGVVFAKDVDSFNLPYIYSFNLKISLGSRLTGVVSNALVILDKIKSLGIETQESFISGNFFMVYTSIENHRIIFNLSDGINIQLASLQLILDKAKMDLQEWEFIDLRFDKPIVRFAPKK